MPMYHTDEQPCTCLSATVEIQECYCDCHHVAGIHGLDHEAVALAVVNGRIDAWTKSIEDMREEMGKLDRRRQALAHEIENAQQTIQALRVVSLLVKED